MKKYIVLSVNDNPKYLFYVPLTVWAWEYFGWSPIIFYNGPENTDLYYTIFLHMINKGNGEKRVFNLNNIEGYQSETIAQVSRLYGACVGNGYIMTGDIDMIPLSDYWKPDPDKLTVYGRDLTDYHFPICYIGMTAEKWWQVMLICDDNYNRHIKEDLDTMPQAKSNDKAKRWVTDQDLITERINSSFYVPERIDRGTGKNGYPIGRVDRSAWTLNHDVFIDAHLPHDILTNDASFKKVLELLHHIWPKEDFKWFINYYKEFKKLA